jgi:prepilin-type N-terminal cleavage/methylation domain-containing protein/prepilin-type processing-associated H-X9-DG protein
MFGQGDTSFTLVELLVVIAVIGLAAAILVPVGQSMLRSGGSAQASSNLRQIGVLYGTYVADTGRLPPYMLSSLGLPGEQYPFFQNALRMQAGLPTRPPQGAVNEWLPEIFYDPVLPKGRRHLWGCFGVNPEMLTRGPQLPSVQDWLAGGAAVGQPPTLVSTPSKKVLACTTRGNGNPYLSSWNVVTNWIAQGGKTNGGPDARHGGKALALFVDGHIDVWTPTTWIALNAKSILPAIPEGLRDREYGHDRFQPLPLQPRTARENSGSPACKA